MSVVVSNGDAAVVVAADVVESFVLRGSAVTMNTYNTATS
jgi:hypothetical protein